MSGSAIQPLLVLAQEESSGLLKGLQQIGSVVAPISALGGVGGLILAAFWKTFWPQAEIQYGEWISYSAALTGLFALVVELTQRAG